MECEEYRGDSEVEPDSDHEDGDGYTCGGAGGGGTNGGWLGHPLHNFHTDLDSYETGTVRRRTKTIVTPKMAMESFRLSFLNDDQDVNFDAILGELYELESQLNSTQSELSRSLEGGPPGPASHPPPPAGFQDEGLADHSGSSETLHVSEQEELDQLAAEISRGLPYHRTNGHSTTASSSSPSHPYQQQHPHHPHHHHHHPHHHQHLTIAGIPTPHGGPSYPGGGGENMSETDSAFSDNASLPSSESYTSMATVSSSADTTSSSSGENCSVSGAVCGPPHSEEEHIARMKAEKIRIALEKIREAKIRKLFVRAFAKDGSSKSILVDEKMSVAQVCTQLADKNHVRLNHKLSVVEHMPELLMERILEDHDSLVESMVMWTRDSKNKIMFEERMDKYDLFRNPEKYLLNLTGSKQAPLSAAQKDKLIQEFFAPESVCVPSMEGALYLKSDGKKAWKKFFFVLRASGLYYNPKGKASKNPKDLACLVQFDYVEVYRGLGWKKKYHAPSDFCFALKHPQIQKKTSKYIRYFCAETEMALDQWVMGIRTVKLGKQMLHNYERLTHEISMWDLRPPEPGAVAADESLCQMLNHADLSDSRMSVPEPGSRHSVIQVHNASLVRNPSSASSSGGVSNSSSKDVLSIEVLAMAPRKGSESGTDGRSLSGSVSSGMSSESGHKTPVKRVSFSATHSIINGDSGEQTVKHRDSIISASTDSSEDSNSSGETRASFRGKMRPRLPLTTETTRQMAEMCNVSMDETPEAIYAEAPHRGITSSSLSSSSSTAFARSDRRRASMQERRGSCGSGNSESGQRLGHLGRSSMKQHSLDSGESTLTRTRQHSPVATEGHYTHVRRKSEPSVTDLIGIGKEEPTYSPVYAPSPGTDDSKAVNGSQYSRLGHQEPEPLYNQIRSTKAPAKQPAQVANDTYSAIPPPPQFGIGGDDVSHIAPPLPPPPPHMDHEPSPPLPPPPSHIQHMQVPPPPPPVSSPKPSTSVSQQQPHKQTGPTPQSSSPALQPSSQSHAKSPPPATLPKPTLNSSNTPPISNNINTPPFANSNNTPVGNTRASPFSSNMTAPDTSHKSPPVAKTTTPPPQSHSLPKQAPPPPPLRLCSNDSTCSSVSGIDSVSGSPLHVPMPPPMPPINPKLPPPTLPKTASPRPGPPPPPPPGPTDASLLSRLNTSQHNTPPVNPAVAAEMSGGPPQSPSLPFLSELSKRGQPESRHDNDGVETRGGQSHTSNQQHRRSASSGGSGSIKAGQKAMPPPPPKRSENTRLSGEVAQKGSHHTSPSPDPIANHPNGSPAIHDPIYENYDGIMDIDELPPPPPELLMDFAPSDSCEQRTSGSGKKAKPPPPPPKRSKETQLSSH